MPGGYGPPQLILPAPLPTGSVNAPIGSLMSLAQRLATPGNTAQGPVPYAQPDVQGHFTQQAYQLAGPAPQPIPRPAASGGLVTLPMTDPASILTGGGAGSIPGQVLGAINQGNSLYQNGSKLADAVGGGTSLTSAGSGALANGALADAGFMGATPALDLGTAGAGLSAIGGMGTGALGASTFAEASPSAAAAIDAASSGSSGLGGLLAGSGAATALPLAALGFAAANYFNAPGKEDHERISATFDALKGADGWSTVTINPKVPQLLKGPDGSYYNYAGNDDFKNFSRAYTRGNMDEALQYYKQWLVSGRNTKYKGG